MIASEAQQQSLQQPLRPQAKGRPPLDLALSEELDRGSTRDRHPEVRAKRASKEDDRSPHHEGPDVAKDDPVSEGDAAPRRMRAAPNDIWTADRVELLKTHFEAGLSCRQIACEIGVTRNAVIGKLNRLGLKRGRGAAGAPERTGLRTRRGRALTQRRILQTVFAEAPPLLAEEPIASAERCSLLEITDDKCRWPITEPGTREIWFCGNRSVAGLSYCPGHARIAYRAPAQRYG
jgi:GcrA cell cycle regulator